MKLILVRHGQSQFNLENRFTGWKNVDITELGQQEAHKAGILLKNEHVDVAFTSMLIRAQHTLQIILEDCNLTHIPIIKNQALNERAYGDLEGLNKAEVTKEFGEAQVHQWRRSYAIPPPNGESLKDTYNRVIPYFVSEIIPFLEDEKVVLIVAHGNSLRALVKFIELLDDKAILEIEIATGIPHTYLLDSEKLNLLKRNFKDEFQ